jgi:peptidoglycan/xylan/chitin deacetylase (PgdA/CDA1 family)
MILAVSVCLIVAASMFAADKPERFVAITIDDLPGSAAGSMSATAITEMTAKLLGTLRDQKVPVVGFVNENKLYKLGEVDARIGALRMWLDYGFELGNHTFSHASLNRVGLKAWEDEVVAGESVTRMLLAEHKMKMRYFRHPYLDTGRDMQTRREAEAFLTQRGYRIAPITLDAWDWMYATVYDDAKRRGDTELQDRVAKSYLEYSDQVFDYDEKLSKRVVGYEVKQILLIHGNQLEADHIGDLLDVFRKRGYHFVTLEEALGDMAYGLPDEYVGEEGTGWLDHWAVTQGKPPQGAPVFPQWVIDLATPLRQPAPQTPQSTPPY